MAVNPMQRKANNSFLLGILITLLITGVIIALLLMQVSKLNKEIKQSEASKVYGYIITDEVKSGTEITSSQVQGVEIRTSSTSDIIYDAKTKDEKGNEKPDATGALLPTGLKAKVDLHAGTILTSDLTYEDEIVAADVRKQEYNIISLPTQLQTGEFVDIRLTLPNGQDYIVVSHKQVEIPTINGIDSEKCIWMQLSEVEILNMSSAIIEAYKMNGGKLYATRYVEPGIQEAAKVTYLPSGDVLALMMRDPNAVAEAKNALYARYRNGDESKVVRDPINSAIRNENANDNLQEGVKNEIQGLQEERQKYLESLGM